MTTNNTILLVEDRPTDRELYKAWLEAAPEGYRVLEAGNLIDGAALYNQERPCCVVLDFILPDGDGLEFIMNLSRGGALKVPVVFITGYGSAELMEDTKAMGAYKTIAKDQLTAQTLQAAVASTLAHFA